VSPALISQVKRSDQVNDWSTVLQLLNVAPTALSVLLLWRVSSLEKEISELRKAHIRYLEKFIDSKTSAH
jgi:hypothetical protein